MLLHGLHAETLQRALSLARVLGDCGRGLCMRSRNTRYDKSGRSCRIVCRVWPKPCRLLQRGRYISSMMWVRRRRQLTLFCRTDRDVGEVSMAPVDWTSCGVRSSSSSTGVLSFRRVSGGGRCKSLFGGGGGDEEDRAAAYGFSHLFFFSPADFGQ